MIERNENRIIADSWEELGLKIPNHQLHSSADIKLRHCPECKTNGKRRDSDYSVSINPAGGKGHCHKCGAVYLIRTNNKSRENKMDKQYTPPSRENLTKLSEAGVKMFRDRRITQDAINFFKVVERRGYVGFPFFDNGELVNIKYRAISDKKFSQSPNGKHVVFNYDEARKSTTKKVIITEGEVDTMSFYVAGYNFAVSVDAGAPNPNDNVDKKLECITNCFDLFENAEVIYLAVDNDENGRRLQQELLRRFDTDKCRLVDFGKYKDANEVLMYEGPEGLAHCIETAKDVVMPGVIRLDDVRERLNYIRQFGLPKGSTTHLPSIDKRWMWRETEVSLGTGYANEGKSEVFDVNLPLLKAVYDGWKVGLFIPENMPAEEFFENVIHTHTGKTNDVDLPHVRCSEEEFQESMDFINEHFFIVHPEEAPTLDALFKRFDYLVRKHGIRIAIIDPFNMVENLFSGNKTYDLYISEFMTKLKQFAIKRKLCVVLVAHQNKPATILADGNWPEPSLYGIKGGGTFADKADNVLYVHRPFRISDSTNGLVHFGASKIKKKKLLNGAETGYSEIFYEWRSNRYKDPLLQMRNPLDEMTYMPVSHTPVVPKISEDFTGELPF